MKIKISKGDFGVPTNIKVSWNEGSHKVAVILTSEGEYSYLLDRRIYTPSEFVAKRGLYKEAVLRASNEMLKAYSKHTDAFLHLYRQTPIPIQKGLLERKLLKLTPNKYSREVFPIPMPRKSDVESDLKEEATHRFFSLWSSNSSKKEQFVSCHIEEEYNARMKDWNELKSYHEAIQNQIEAQKNQEYQTEYEASRKVIEDELYGDFHYVMNRLTKIESQYNGQIAFDITLDVNYLREDGVIEATATLPPSYNIEEHISEKQASLLQSGRVSIKNKLKRELDEERNSSLIGISYFISGLMFSLAVNINKVRFALYTGVDALYWVEFERKFFTSTSYQTLQPLQDFFTHPNVINYKRNVIEHIPETDFQKRIIDAVGISLLLASNSDLCTLRLSDAEKICKAVEGTDDLKDAVKKAKSNKSSIVVTDRRYLNILSEIG